MSKIYLVTLRILGEKVDWCSLHVESGSIQGAMRKAIDYQNATVDKYNQEYDVVSFEVSAISETNIEIIK